MTGRVALPALGEALRVWARIGLLSFGGPAGQIAMLHREIVVQRGWIGERRFLHALSFCALLPGPEAQQLATYLGWLMHGPVGGVAAGTLFVLPGALLLLVLSALYARLGQVPVVDGLFFGLKCAVLALVVQALLRLSDRALRSAPAWWVAAAAFLALNLFATPFPVVVLGAGMMGAMLPGWFRPGRHDAAAADTPGLIERVMQADPGFRTRRDRGAWRAGAIAAALWGLPVAGLQHFSPGTYAELAWFFSKMAVVTVGGAYAVLAYVAQDAVHLYHWVTAPEMLAGLGLAETTPGPLILVLQFVGFMAGYHAPGALTGMAGGIAASALVLWVTFLPCFAFVFLGAPLVERLVENRVLAGALAAITASVVGVIGNLALWFGLHVLFSQTGMLHLGPAVLEVPRLSSLDGRALLLAMGAAALLFRLRQNVPRTLAVSAAAGMLLRLV